MKQPSLYIYRSANFDGNLYVKAVGIAEWGSCQITLVKDNENLATLQGTTWIFTNQGYGQYQAIATVGNQRDSSIMLTSKTLNISPTHKTQCNPITTPRTETKIQSNYSGNVSVKLTSIIYISV